MPKNNNMGTYTLVVGTYLIPAADGIRVMSLTLSAAGIATVQGAAKSSAMGASAAISLSPGIPTIVSNQDPIDGFTIEVTAGTVTVYTNQ
jgi:hypothetical protein